MVVEQHMLVGPWDRLMNLQHTWRWRPGGPRSLPKHVLTRVLPSRSKWRWRGLMGPGTGEALE